MRAFALAAPAVLLFSGPLAGWAQDEPVLGSRSRFALSTETQETVRLEAGSRLREQPDLRSAEIAGFDEAIELPVVERRGTWVRVAYGNLRGWTLAHAPLDRTAEPFAGGGRLYNWGMVEALTDIEDPVLLADLGKLAARLPALYRERYGLELDPTAIDRLMMFSRRDDYRAYTDSAGSSGAALTIDAASPAETRALLAQEIGRLLNRRALGGAELPAWLDQGLALDLAGDSRSGAEHTDEGTFIRFLRTGESGRYAERFRAFLRQVAAGAPTTKPALAAALGLEGAELERDFAAWQDQPHKP